MKQGSGQKKIKAWELCCNLVKKIVYLEKYQGLF